MTLISVDVFPKTESAVEIVDANGEISVDVGPALIQTVAIEDSNGQYSVELSMTPMGPEGPEGKPGRVIDILGSFGVSKTPADLPANGLIQKDWDASGSPAKTIQFQIGDGLIYLPADTTTVSYGHVFAYTGGEFNSPWLDCGIIKGDKGDKGDTGSVGAKGDKGEAGASNVLSIGTVVQGDSPAVSITGSSPAQTLNFVLQKGDKGDAGAAGKDGIDGHTPTVDMAGDQIRIDGIVTGPHLTGPQGPQGEVGKSLTILGHYDTEQELNTAHPTGKEGDCYLVGQGYLYVWDGAKWANVGQLQGPKGDKGDTGSTGPVGPANNLTIGNVTSGTAPSVTIRGTTPNQIIDFVLAKGDKGDKGDQGIQGLKGDQGDPGGVGPKGDTGSQGPKGDTGSAGPANTLAIGTVTGGATASATITGASPNQTLNLVLPKGADGAQGPKGDTGAKGSDASVTTANITAALGYTPIGAASPALSGVPTAPTATKGTNTTQIATTAFVLANAAAGGVSSVNGKTGAVTLTNTDVGAPATNGTGATGTWPIGISGSAAQLGGVAAASYATQAWVGQQGFPKLSAANSWTATQYFAQNVVFQAANNTFVHAGEGQVIFKSAAPNAGWLVGENSDQAFVVYRSPTYGCFIGSTGVTWMSRSDARLKTDLTKIESPLQKLDKIEGYRGRYTYDPEGVQRLFLLAQEVREVLPEVVCETRKGDGDSAETPDEILCIAYSEIVPFLVSAIKELKSELDELKKQISPA